MMDIRKRNRVMGNETHAHATNDNYAIVPCTLDAVRAPQHSRSHVAHRCAITTALCSDACANVCVRVREGSMRASEERARRTTYSTLPCGHCFLRLSLGSGLGSGMHIGCCASSAMAPHLHGHGPLMRVLPCCDTLRIFRRREESACVSAITQAQE